MGYSQKVFEGFGWHSLMRFAASGLALVKMMFLARLLNVEDFGLFSLTAIALGLMEAMTETGINVIILRSPKNVEYFLNTAWVISILRGLLIAIAMLIMGIGMSNWYQEPELLWLVSLASFIPIIKGFINPAIISFYKNLAFFQDTLYRLSLVLVEGVAAIVLAFLFRSVYVFIWAMLLAAVYEVVFSFLVVKAKPAFVWSSQKAREIFNQAKLLNISAWLEYVVENGDNLIIGKLTNKVDLGFYDNGYKLSHKPNFDLSRSVHHGTFPIFSKLQHQPSRSRKAFTRVLVSSGTLFILASLPLLLFPHLVISIILGQKWLAVVPLIRILTVAGLIQGFRTVCYSYLKAMGQFVAINYHLGVTAVTMIGLVWWLGSLHGLLGAVWAILLSRLLALPFVLVPVSRLLYAKK